jgi:hypothetical protein
VPHKLILACPNVKIVHMDEVSKDLIDLCKNRTKVEKLLTLKVPHLSKEEESETCIDLREPRCLDPVVLFNDNCCDLIFQHLKI